MAESLGVFAAEAKKWPADAAHKWKVFCAVGELRLPSLHCSAVARGKAHWVAESSLEVRMRIIQHSHTSARITEFVKEDRVRVNIKVTPSLQYTDGIELRASIDDTTAAIVYLRLDDLRMIIDFIWHQGTVRQKELLALSPAQPNPVQGTASPRSQIEALLGAAHELSDAKRLREKPAKDTGRLLPKMPLPEHLRRKN